MRFREIGNKQCDLTILHFFCFIVTKSILTRHISTHAQIDWVNKSGADHMSADLTLLSYVGRALKYFEGLTGLIAI